MRRNDHFRRLLERFAGPPWKGDPTTGALSYQGCVSSPSSDVGGCTRIAGARPVGLNTGLGRPTSVAVSPDSRSIYAGSEFGDALARFDRRPARCHGRRATLVGTVAPDTIAGTLRRDVIVAQAGADRINARAGNDLVCAGRGADLVFAGFGRDRVLGQLGADRIFGGPGPDFLFGQTGFDRIFGRGGNDRALGGAGRDLLIGNRGRDHLFGGAGRDTLRGLRGRGDLCNGGPGRDRRRAPGCEIIRSIP